MDTNKQASLFTELSVSEEEALAGGGRVWNWIKKAAKKVAPIVRGIIRVIV